jgi:hypothetical protein
MVEIVEALHVTAPWLDSGVSLTAVQTVGNVHFAKVLKTDPRIYRLLVGKTRAAESSITIAPIIDTLVELRKDKRAKLLSELAALKAVDELDIDRASSESFAHLLPKTVEITTPAVNDTEPGLPMKVLCMHPHHEPGQLEAEDACEGPVLGWLTEVLQGPVWGG